MAKASHVLEGKNWNARTLYSNNHYFSVRSTIHGGRHMPIPFNPIFIIR